MNAAVYSADELMRKTGCQSMREFRAWLRKNKIRCIDAPAGPIVAHEGLLDAMGINRAQDALCDPAMMRPI